MIYHYCSLDKLHKIITSKELYLFNANSMNDSLETIWIIHLINEELSKRKEDFNNDVIQNLNISFSFNRTYPYISCFSSDSDSLSQWRAYADDGKGVAIGFNEEYFGIPKIIPVNTFVKNNSIGYFDCIYDEAYQRKLINNALNDALPFEEDKFIETTRQLVQLSVIFKNPCFSEEKEVRLIHAPMIMGNKENKTILMTSISEINFIVKGNSIVSYFKFDLREKFNSDLIPEIILGPKLFLNVNEFGTYLSVNNLTKTTFRHSQASYR
jgi:hypothetical protein